MSDNRTAAERLRDAGSAAIADVLLERGLRSVVINGPTWRGPGDRFAGPAATLRFVPAREDRIEVARSRTTDYPQRTAIDGLAPGSVLVIAGGVDAPVAVLGEMLVSRLASIGVAGVVADGSVRDAAAIHATGVPIVARGTASMAHAGWLEASDAGMPVNCGGIQVRPGDVIVADVDGTVCVPEVLVEEVARAGVERLTADAADVEAVRRGDPIPGG